MDRSRGPKRFSFRRFSFDRSDLHRLAVSSAVSAQKHIEIIFEGTDSSCYPWLSLGAEGIVSSTSRSPN
jgi:dihydrodipicolinate synthase/N-acetylneuraminate lyase